MKLKIVSLSLFLFLSLINHSNAQESQFGIKAGINVNDLGGKYVGMYSTLGVHGGFYWEKIISSYFSVLPEITVSLQGAAFDRSSDSKLNYTYLNIPILGKFYLVDNMALEIGPQIGFLLTAKEKTDLGTINITDQVRTTDFAVVFGISYKYRNRMGITLRYNLGITNTNMQDVVYEARFTNRVFQASLSYIL